MTIEKTIRRGIPILAAVLWANPLVAAEIDHRREYRDCMELAHRDPEAANEVGKQWQALGGGEPAQHCIATALFKMGHPAEAAKRLEALAESSRQDADVRAGLLAQAAQAWLAEGDPARAQTTLTAALKLVPDEPGLLIDRAVAVAALGNYADAARDLSQAIEIDRGNPEAWVLRAAARRHLGETPGALADVDAALKLTPNYPDALLERGMLKRLAGDAAGARADWMRVLQTAPDADVADSARAQLEAMDGNVK